MKQWRIEIVTDHVRCNYVYIDANEVIKLNHWTLSIDDHRWGLPALPGLSFAEVSEVKEERYK